LAPISILGFQANHSSFFFSTSCAEANLNRCPAGTSAPGCGGVENAKPPDMTVVSVSISILKFGLHVLKSNSLAEAFMPPLVQNCVFTRISFL
jgi:hypothetical protein